MTSSKGADEERLSCFEQAPEMLARRIVEDNVIDFWDGPRAGIFYLSDPDEYFAYEEIARMDNPTGCDQILAETWKVSSDAAIMLQSEASAAFCEAFFKETRSVIVLHEDGTPKAKPDWDGSFKSLARLDRPGQPSMYIAYEDGTSLHGAWRAHAAAPMTPELAASLLREAFPAAGR